MLLNYYLGFRNKYMYLERKEGGREEKREGKKKLV